MLITYSYAYIPALVILVSSLTFISVYLSLENNGFFTHYLTISPNGLVLLGHDSYDYQLLATSRLGFLGCWLDLQRVESLCNSTQKNRQVISTQLFIFKDSLSEQDYARLVRVLKQL